MAPRGIAMTMPDMRRRIRRPALSTTKIDTENEIQLIVVKKCRD